MSRICHIGLSGALAAILVGILSSPARLAAEEAKPTEGKTKAKKVSLDASKKKIEFPSPSKETLEALLQMHNEVRARNGLAAFKLHPKLTAAAQRYAEYSYRTHRFGHYADGQSPAERIAAEGLAHESWAENMARGQQTPYDAMHMWLNSSGHHGNILSVHTHVGFGRVGNVWVTVFANPAEQENADQELAQK